MNRAFCSFNDDEYKALPEAEKEKIKRILYDELTKNRP